VPENVFLRLYLDLIHTILNIVKIARHLEMNGIEVGDRSIFSNERTMPNYFAAGVERNDGGNQKKDQVDGFHDRFN
jgi:hypothetical protein